MNFASYTSSEYFPIFLTFYDSIKKNKNLNLYVLCLDDDVKSLIKKNNIKCKTITIEDIELFTKSLLKKRYSKISEKIGVYRLAYANYLLKKLNIEDIHLIDSDTYFFSKTSDLEKIVNDLDASVCFCKHNYFYNRDLMNDLYGIYNAGYIYFKNDKQAFKFLVKYRKLCQNYISWSVKKNTKNLFADQTYLEGLIQDFKFTKIINNKGVNCAPWNIGNYQISEKEGQFYVDNVNIIFFHFSGVRTLFNKVFFYNLYYYNKVNLKHVKKTIYKNYLTKLKKNLIKIPTKKDTKAISLKRIIAIFSKLLRKDFSII